ncbi:SIS domain-containing protein [Mycoplasmatota bacterium WC44]
MFGKTKEYYIDNKSTHTVNEIFQQPSTWLKTFTLIKEMESQVMEFFSHIDEGTQVYLVGAGTSEFVGNTITPFINNLNKRNVQSVSTTNIVSNPWLYFKKSQKTLVVSYGRSGSSPESVATVNLANEICDDIHHLVITCNKDGHLAKESKGKDNYLSIILPDETHDKSFAMTSSYTNMMLASILVFDIDNIDKHEENVTKVVEMSNEVLENRYSIIDSVVTQFDFKRIVYLGSATLKGTAQESALKILELSGGKVATMFDSPLGFRHGPKSIIQDDVLTVLYLSDNDYTRKYELDLLKEMCAEKGDNKILVISNRKVDESINNIDYKIELNFDSVEDDVLLSFVYIIVGQLIGMKKALHLGISSDNPCPSGTVNRVVKGVTIYEYRG